MCISGGFLECRQPLWDLGLPHEIPSHIAASLGNMTDSDLELEESVPPHCCVYTVERSYEKPGVTGVD